MTLLEVFDEPSANGPAAEPPVIDARGLTRTFPGPVHALREADLRVDRGDYVSVIGASGSGKSTLLHLLGLLDRPTSGTYLLDGVDTSAITEADRAALRGGRIGFVFQSFHLLPHRTVLENVLLATLYSGVPRGERQRVAVARAVVASPHVLLADEPTGNLDTATSAGVMDLFDELHSDGLTLVVITHDPAVSARARRRVRITDGTLTEVA